MAYDHTGEPPTRTEGSYQLLKQRIRKQEIALKEIMELATMQPYEPTIGPGLMAMMAGKLGAIYGTAEKALEG